MLKLYSKLPIGDLDTQYFADRDIFCAGRVGDDDDIKRVRKATGATINHTCNDIREESLGTCGFLKKKPLELKDIIFLKIVLKPSLQQLSLEQVLNNLLKKLKDKFMML